MRKTRSGLVAIGVVLLVVLLAGGAAGVYAVRTGDVVPSTIALVVVVASVALVLVALICALFVVRNGFVPADEVPPAAEAAAVGADDRREREPRPAPQPSDEFNLSALAASQWAPRKPEEPNPEVFSRIASRLQAKVSRAFVDLDALERKIEDPELLATVFRLDHLVTRIRREVENLSVLGGDTPQSRSTQPAEVNQVLRLAVASTEDYQRIMTFPLRGVKIHGHVVAELINIVAELLDNATTFTPPQAPKIALTASRVGAGLAIEVHDRGIGMPPEDIERVNRLLAGYTDVDLHQLLDEGRIGFAVVNKLAPRHNIRVQLRANIFGGIDAAVVVPHNLLSEPEEVYGGRPSAMRLEAGLGRAPSAVAAARPQPPSVSQSGDVPWPPPADPGEGLTERVPNGRHSRFGERPSPYPRSPMPEPGGVPDEQPAAWPAQDGVAQGVQVAVAPTAERPPLPQRGSETYLRPELRQPPRVARVSPGHNPDLLVDVMRGREDAELENSDGGQ